jgi:hypothetical protein
MITKIWRARSLALCLTLAFLTGSTQLVLERARAQERTGELMVTGKARVNGQPAATGDIVSSGGTVETAKMSSAVVSLGGLGRVEALPGTRLKLRFDDASISILLDTGSVRLSTGPSVAATVTTRDD